jgi:hypothetical protein
VPRDSTITDPGQLSGQKIAATQGTDPYFFLLQTLAQAGLSASDVEIVNLQHSDGKLALERGDVAAWAGLDPFMAQTELEAGSRLIYRNLDFNSYGLLNATEDFLAQKPDVAQKVVNAYERARAWIQENPDAAVQTLAASRRSARTDPDRCARTVPFRACAPSIGRPNARTLGRSRTGRPASPRSGRAEATSPAGRRAAIPRVPRAAGRSPRARHHGVAPEGRGKIDRRYRTPATSRTACSRCGCPDLIAGWGVRSGRAAESSPIVSTGGLVAVIP